MPPAVFSSASRGSTTTRSSRGRTFKSLLMSQVPFLCFCFSQDSEEPGGVKAIPVLRTGAKPLHVHAHAAHSTHTTHASHSAHATHTSHAAATVVVVMV